MPDWFREYSFLLLKYYSKCGAGGVSPNMDVGNPICRIPNHSKKDTTPVPILWLKMHHLLYIQPINTD